MGQISNPVNPSFISLHGNDPLLATWTGFTAVNFATNANTSIFSGNNLNIVRMPVASNTGSSGAAPTGSNWLALVTTFNPNQFVLAANRVVEMEAVLTITAPAGGDNGLSHIDVNLGGSFTQGLISRQQIATNGAVTNIANQAYTVCVHWLWTRTLIEQGPFPYVFVNSANAVTYSITDAAFWVKLLA